MTLKSLRQSLGLSQTQMAEVLRLAPDSGQRTIRDWETGRRNITGPASLCLDYIARYGLIPACKND